VFICVHRRLNNLFFAGLLLSILTGRPGFSQNPSGVSISFDRVVRPPPSRQTSDSAQLWLRLRNNRRAPIQMLASAPEGGADGVEIVHEIVEDPGAKPASGWISPPEHYSPVNEATTLEIQPNSDQLFSVPINHVGPSWRLRITYQSGRRREGTVDFTWAGVPVKERNAWKK
jgi:hypothetical protein